MRIVAGHLKGRSLQGPIGPGVRPTSDRLRETLFNVIRDRVVGARLLDGFAGTGAVGLEAFSRGAHHVTFVERDRRTIPLLEQNIVICGGTSATTVVKDDFLGVSTRHPRIGQFDVVFVDPPYDTEDLAEVMTEAAALVVTTGLVVLEHSRRRTAPEGAAGIRRNRTLLAGDSVLAFYTPMPLG